ncbi:S8 family serine peptidase [Rhodobium gokarnense]|uniref:Peptidase S8/S53 domain-containing protein n=1 Tax=Rhodobium gokarnense TaxID=364296 RepID=A0ABT3HAD9_9HYPH|nr:S8 family serine peptidase [Rhodobium gokarnense]MCW2307361.1 hypothetical protein [Rhodobium gokarnense]
MEVLGEMDLEALATIPDGFQPAGDETTLARTLYATMPTLESFRTLLSCWNDYKNNIDPPRGFTGWRAVFDLLLDVHPWGPKDRLDQAAINEIAEHLPLNDDEAVNLEIEIFPTSNQDKRNEWRRSVRSWIRAANGEILDQSTIAEDGFIYEALLVNLPAGEVRALIGQPDQPGSLAQLEGIQFIQAQTIAQSIPSPDDTIEEAEKVDFAAFSPDAPQRAVLLDGTPVAQHPALTDGVSIEDLNDLVGQTIVSDRKHATAMASLILRGDLRGDGAPLQDSSLLAVPVLIDTNGSTESPPNRLFVDIIHSTLYQLFAGDEPLAPDAFVVNFSIGIRNHGYANRISSLARLIDWWANAHGVLFVISAGNNESPIEILNTGYSAFEALNTEDKRKKILEALHQQRHIRTLLSPAEALNPISVGALSQDVIDHQPPHDASIFSLHMNEEAVPQISSCLGLGHVKAIKPDILSIGGKQEVRLQPSGNDVRIRPSTALKRSGLVVAAANATGGVVNSHGTSDAAALTTRSLLLAAEALTTEGGPYEGQELPRRQLALMTKALAIHAARWPTEADEIKNIALQEYGAHGHKRAKDDISRFYGHGILDVDLMTSSPETGATAVGYGHLRKDQALVFKLPKPPSMSGQKMPRTMRVTVAWFSPMNPSRAQYRLAALEPICTENHHSDTDNQWGFSMKSASDCPDINAQKKGTVFSRRLTNAVQKVPSFGDEESIPICIQCRDAASGGLSPDEEIEFAVVVSLQAEIETQFDILDEIQQAIQTSVVVGQ